MHLLQFNLKPTKRFNQIILKHPNDHERFLSVTVGRWTPSLPREHIFEQRTSRQYERFDEERVR